MCVCVCVVQQLNNGLPNYMDLTNYMHSFIHFAFNRVVLAT